MLAAQWVIDPDIGLTTFQGANGLTVFARSYATAKPIDGIKLTLVARNNKRIGDGRDRHERPRRFRSGILPRHRRRRAGRGDGLCGRRFQLSRSAPARVRSHPIAVSGGRASPGPVDAYLYTERGIYRPGESVQSVTLLLRDRVGAAVTAPLTLVADRPDGMEVARTTIAGSSLAAGSAAWTLPLNPTAPQGRWRMSAYLDPKADPVGRVEFDVADFVPQRLKVTLTPVEKILHANSDMHVRAESRFLYGAPASGLSGEGEARITTDPDPYPDFSLYQFGRVDDPFSPT